MEISPDGHTDILALFGFKILIKNMNLIFPASNKILQPEDQSEKHSAGLKLDSSCLSCTFT